MIKNRFYFVVFIFFILMVTSCSKNTHDKLYGEWKGTDNSGATASFLFGQDGTARMICGNRVADDKSIGGKVEWQINDKATPMELDILITDSTKTTFKIPLIFRFITDNQIQIRMSDDIITRPPQFSETDDNSQINFLRQ